METKEYEQGSTEGKKHTGVWPFFIIIGVFSAILILIKLVTNL